MENQINISLDLNDHDYCEGVLVAFARVANQNALLDLAKKYKSNKGDVKSELARHGDINVHNELMKDPNLHDFVIYLMLKKGYVPVLEKYVGCKKFNNVISEFNNPDILKKIIESGNYNHGTLCNIARHNNPDILNSPLFYNNKNFNVRRLTASHNNTEILEKYRDEKSTVVIRAILKNYNPEIIKYQLINLFSLLNDNTLNPNSNVLLNVASVILMHNDLELTKIYVGYFNKYFDNNYEVPPNVYLEILNNISSIEVLEYLRDTEICPEITSLCNQKINTLC